MPADGYAIYHEFAVEPDDILILKQRASIFQGTPLFSHLSLLGVQSLIVCGESTSGCVRASVVDGYSSGFHVSVVEECTYDRAELTHKVNLFDMHHKYADVMHVDEVLAHLASTWAGACGGVARARVVLYAADWSRLSSSSSRAAAPGAVDNAAPVNFAGKQIRLLIGFSPTAYGYDTYGRLLARYLGKYLPGNPTVVPQNRPGAGSINLASYMGHAAPNDGTEIAIVGRGVAMEPILDAPLSPPKFDATSPDLARQHEQRSRRLLCPRAGPGVELSGCAQRCEHEGRLDRRRR